MKTLSSNVRRVSVVTPRLSVCAFALVLAASASPVLRDGGTDSAVRRQAEQPSLAQAPTAPKEVLPWLARSWTTAGWSHPEGRNRYLRAPDDAAWRSRILALRALVAAGEASVEPLLTALKESTDDELRIFAAQTLGFLGPRVPEEPLLRALRSDTSASVRLYAVDALGMRGSGERLADTLRELAASEKDRDVVKHIQYTLDRGAAAIDAEVRTALLALTPAELGSATIGQPAPDFDLATYDGERVKLSAQRGKAPVVLVFVYGDT